MALTEKDLVVAIEIGSTKISGIAGKKKDGNMQILAYAEEKNKDYVKRGIIWNIEKTYQCINNIIAKLETSLKTRIKYAYVGISGQSVRSYRCVAKRNLLTQSCITKDTIDAMYEDGREIPFNDYDILETIPQEYLIDQNVNMDPVGVMGTNIECEYVNIIAKGAIRANIDNVFANSNVDIADALIAPLQLADNVLTDTEKRSGCVLVDLGAETTTVVVYKNNILRYLVTIPIGSSNINKDLLTLSIDDSEVEAIKLKYADACMQDTLQNDTSEPGTYTTSEGYELDVQKIQNVIEARMNEIIANVTAQIINSNYNGQLLAGIILTGGGSNMKNIDKAFLNSTKLEKVRIAKKISQPVVKAATVSSLVLDNATNNTLVSLLLAANMPCGGDTFEKDLFSQQEISEEQAARRAEKSAKEEAEKKLSETFTAIKVDIRATIDKVAEMNKELENHGKDKATRERVRDFINGAHACISPEYTQCVEAMKDKDKFKQSLKEADELIAMLDARLDELKKKLAEVAKANTLWSRFRNTLEELINE